MIPPKVILSGDVDRADKLRAFGLSQLRILHESMASRDLKQDARRVRFDDGAVIEVKSSFGLDEVSIFVPLVPVEEAEVEAREVARRVGVLGGKIALHAGPAVVTCGPGATPMVWPGDPDGALEIRNPDNIAKGASAPIRVEGGVWPYKWEIGGQGFWFDEEHTLKALEGVPRNVPGWCEVGTGGDQAACEAGGGKWRFPGSWVTLYADNTICGVARIAVTDFCNQIVQGEVPWRDVLSWSKENSGWITGGEHELLRVEGGLPPCTWRVERTEFWFDEEHTIKEIETSGRQVSLYADATVCAGIIVTVEVEDSCDNEASGTVVTRAVPMAWAHTIAEIPCTGGLQQVQLRITGGVAPFSWIKTGALTLVATDAREATLSVGADECGESAVVKVTDACGNELEAQFDVAESGILAWDWENSSGAIVQSGSAGICVIGGTGPFAWEITYGPNFSLDAAETAGRTNTLNAGATACGTCTIRVTDSLEDTCIGQVRCTTGSWIKLEEGISDVSPAGGDCYGTTDPGESSSGCLDEDDYYVYSGGGTKGGSRWKLWKPGCLGTGSGSCNWDAVTWEKYVGGGAVSYPPPCGSPVECHPGSCDEGDCIDGELACDVCFFNRYDYEYWAC